MQALKTGFVIVMLFLIVFPVVMSAVPISQRTPFEAKIEQISYLSNGFVAFPKFPGAPSVSNPVASLFFLANFFFTLWVYIQSIIFFFFHNVSIVSRILIVLFMP